MKNSLLISFVRISTRIINKHFNFYIIELNQERRLETMTWFMNFCAPFMPNDPTINFHRYAQASLVAAYTLAYGIIHIYYRFYQSPKSDSEEPQKKQQQSQKESQSESIDSSEQASEKSKEVSLKIDEQANQSCIQLKKSGTTWNDSNKKTSCGSKKEILPITIQQIEANVPIVYGHFAVSMGLSIMYTPYAEQSIACLLYMLLTIPLMIVNSKRHQKCTIFFWILMCTMLLFILTCGLLQIGQSNWDYINLTCFSTEYVSLYD